MSAKKVYKSARTGRFVSKKTVSRSPNTTYVQTVKSGKKRR